MAKHQGQADANQNAFRVMQEALGEAPKTVPHDKSSAAVERGKARAEKLSPAERSSIASAAAKKRWAH